MNFILKMAVMVSAFVFTAEISAQNYISDKESLVQKGDVAPDFTVNMLNGSTFTLSKLKGKVVLVNFWATWCGPCMQEFKVIPDKLVKRYKDRKDFVFLPISREEKRETVEKKMTELKEKNIDFPVGLDPERQIYSRYANKSIPRNYIIDRNGKIAYTSIGYIEDEFEKMLEILDKLLSK